jgi:hypothetical protein
MDGSLGVPSIAKKYAEAQIMVTKILPQPGRLPVFN